MKFKFILLLSLAPALSTLTACTRETENTRARFSVALPSSGQNRAAAISGQLMHVAINVTGAGLPAPIIFSWDSHQNGTQVAAPTSFDFDVPSGAGRLIQVLAVYEDMTTQSMIFTYGDVTATLPQGNFSVAVAVSEIGAGSVVTGRVAGRYLTGTDSGPTGIVDVHFNPGGGKPPLIIERSYIANGWFAFFMLAGANLEYTVNGTKLFGGPVDLNSQLFIPSAANGNLNRIARASLPSQVRSEGGGGTKKHDKPAIYTWGFWSDNAALVAGKSVCNDLTAGGSFTRIFRYDSVPANATTLLLLNNMPNADQAFPSNAALLATAPGLANVFAGGGTNPACTTLSTTAIPIRKSLIDGNGGDSVAGFRNIFLFDNNNNAFTIAPTATTATVSGFVLPGIPSLYSRIRFYKRVGGVGENFRIETPMCQAIANGASGFIFAGEALSINGGTGAFTATNVDLDTTSTAYTDGRISLVVCGATGPATADLAPVGLFHQIYSGGSSGPYLRMEISGASSNGNDYTATNSQCYPLSLRLYQSPGATPYNAASAVTISGLNPGSTWYEIHTTSACNAMIGTNSSVTIPISVNTYGTPLWLKPISNGSNLVFTGVTASGDGVSFTPANNKYNVGSPTLSFSGPTNAVVWSAGNSLCYELNATRLDFAGMPLTTDPNSLNVSFSGTGYTLYGSTGDCQSGSSPITTNFSIAPSMASMTMYLRATAAGAQTLTTTPVGLYAAATYTVNGFAESGTHSSRGSRFVMTPLTLKAGLCNTLKITHENTGGDEIPVPAPMNVKVSASSTNVVFYTDGSCTTVLSTGTVFFGAQQSSALTYFIPNQAPGSTFAFAGSTGAISGGSTSVAVTTPSTSEEPYMFYTVPTIKSVLLGSHDFTTPKTITFVVSAGATISCEQAPGPAFSAWTACGGQLAGNVFTWSAADAVADIGFRFNLSAPSKPNRMYSFIPSKIYARHGIDFDVMNCNSTLTANGATDFGDINTAQGSSAVVCLEAGTFTGTGGPITPGSSDILLGKTDANGDPASIVQAVPSTVLAQVAANSLTFANLDMRAATSGAGTWLVNSENGTGPNFKSYNNIYRANSFHTVGLRAHGDQGFDSYGDTFIVDGTTASAQGMVTTNSIVNRVYNIKSPMFKLSSHASTSATFATAIKLWTSNADMQIFDAKVDAVLNEGTFLHVLNSGGGWTAAVTVQSSTFSLAGAGDNATRFPIYIQREANVTLNGVRINNSMASDLIRTVHAGPAPELTLTLTDSRLANLVDQRILYVDNTTARSEVVNTTRTHFVRATGAGATSPGMSSASAIPWNLNGPLGTPNTFLCGTSAGTNFSAVAGTAPSFGAYSSPTITNSADSSVMTCQ